MTLVRDFAMPDASMTRVAVVATPRSGNTWLRRLLATLGGLHEVAVHAPWEVPWDSLPERCILQLHWPRMASITGALAYHGFRIVTIARHPLDVLISILHFAPHEPLTARWLDGTGGDEQPIFGVSPGSEPFLRYATGARSTALLGVSHQWWGGPVSRPIRYEDLVDDPSSHLAALAADLGIENQVSPDAAVAANTIESLRTTTANQHFWRGRPGHWKTLLTPDRAKFIGEAHRRVIEDLGYTVDPDASLKDSCADANWSALASKGSSEKLDERCSPT